MFFFAGNTDPKRNNLTGGSEGVSKNAAAAAAAVAASAVSGTTSGGGVTSNLNISPPHQPPSVAPGAGPVMNNGGKDTSNADVQRLQEQLNDIKEQAS